MGVIQTVPGLAEQVHQAILDEICDGILSPGAHLVQEQLAERFGVSRQPIQQAIALLKADGLVEEAGKRGVRVTPLDVTVMRHHYEIRAVLDGLAARCAARRAREDSAVAREADERGHAILDAGARAVAAGAPREQIRHDEALHALIYELSGNPLLARTAEAHWRFLRRVMGEVLRHAQPASIIWRQHAEILEAIVAGDADLAEDRAIAHIRVAAETLADTLTDHSGEVRSVAAGRRP